MAITQVQADKRGITDIAQKDASGYYYITIGAIWIYVGSGDPNGVIVGTVAGTPLGSLFFRVDTPKVYQQTIVNGTWSAVGAET